MKPSEAQRVLLVRLGAIGDVVNALTVATAIKRTRPATHVGWAVHDLALPLVQGHPAVDRVHHWKRGSGLSGFLELRRELSRERYDMAIDLQRITKSALLARASGAKIVLGYDAARTKELSWLWTTERVPPGDSGSHMIEQYADVTRHLECSGEPERVLPSATEAESEVAGWLASSSAPVQINLGASKPANRWAPERFGDLAGRIVRKLDRDVFLTGSPSERPLAEAALSASGDTGRVLDLVGKTSLPQLWSASRRASLFVGCDTGPMHLAAAVDTPVIALFGPAAPRRTGPYGEIHRVLKTDPPCAPCGKKHCTQPRHACMEDLTVDRVFDAVREHLEA